MSPPRRPPLWPLGGRCRPSPPNGPSRGIGTPDGPVRCWWRGRYRNWPRWSGRHDQDGQAYLDCFASRRRPHPPAPDPREHRYRRPPVNAVDDDMAGLADALAQVGRAVRDAVLSVATTDSDSEIVRHAGGDVVFGVDARADVVLLDALRARCGGRWPGSLVIEGYDDR